MKKKLIFAILSLFCLAVTANALTGPPEPEPDLTNRTNITWIGSYNASWHEPTNWSPAQVPTWADNVTINGGSTYYPAIDAAASCANLIVYGGGVVNISRGSLTVWQNYDNYGTFMTSAYLMEWLSPTLDVGGSLIFRAGSAANLSTSARVNSIIRLSSHLNIYSGANVQLTRGSLYMVGEGGPSIWVESGSGCYLNDLIIQKDSGYYVSLSSDVTVGGSITIVSGELRALSQNIYLKGNWNNQAGLPAFVEGSGTVTFCGDTDQQIISSEQFYNVVMDKYLGAVVINNSAVSVTWGSYTLLYGGDVKVLAGTLNVQNLAQGSILGNWYLYDPGRINLYGQSGGIDLDADLHIFGGVFTVYGGGAESQWSSPAFSSLEMSAGVLYFANQGINIGPYVPGEFGYSFTENITGGTIRVNGGFTYSSQFTPAGGTVEIYQTTNANIASTESGHFYDLLINAGLGVYLTTDISVAHNVTLRAGYLAANSFNINLGGSWYNENSELAFDEGTGTVTFNGNDNQYVINNENFHQVTVNKSSGTVYMSSTVDPAPFICIDHYDWVSGSIHVYHGTLEVYDLMAGYIEGVWYQGEFGQIRLYGHEGIIDLGGELHISGGTFSVIGGGFDSIWPRYGTTALVEMSAGLLEFTTRGVQIGGNEFSFFSQNITGGTIRVNGSFKVNTYNYTFAPYGGTVEMAGTSYANLYIQSPATERLQNLMISNTGGVALTSDVTCLSSVLAQNGPLDLNGRTLTCYADVDVYGILQVDENASLLLSADGALTVQDGGRLEAIGGLAGRAIIASVDESYYNFWVLSGGTISANYAAFSYMGLDGVYVAPGAIVDPSNSFTDCQFAHSPEFGHLLTLDNSDNLLIQNAAFYTDGNQIGNVSKTIDAGVVNFANATGTYAGEDHDMDEFERIIWTSPTAAYDLRVLKASFETATAYPGDWIRVKVAMVNASTTPCSIPYWIYLYFNRDTPPPLHLVGDTWVRDYTTRTGLPFDFTFEFYLYDPIWIGEWTSWLQIDGEGEVPEANETNNVYGPIQTFELLGLPPVTDLAINYIESDFEYELTWSYPLNPTRFDIYRSQDPMGVFEYWASEYGYSRVFYDNVQGDRMFYQVKAVREGPPPKQAERQ